MKLRIPQFGCIVFLFLLIASPILGQQIGGTINDETGQPVALANVALLKWPDSTIASRAISDLDGKYQIKNPGQTLSFRILVTGVGFANQISPVFNNNISNQTWNPIMIQKTGELQTLEVVKQKAAFRQEGNKMVVDVAGSGMGTGLMALDLLKKLPGLVVDQDGNISLKGKDGVQILLDGKPTYLSKEQLSALLRNTSAQDIDKIEIVTQPGAEYDAQGTGGLLNIKRKRKTALGLQGDLQSTLGQGQFYKSNSGINLSYGKGKAHFFGGYSYTNNGQLMDIDNNRKFPLNGNNEGINLKTYYRIFGQSHNMRFGADYETGKSSFSVDGTLRSGHELFLAQSTSKSLDANGNLQSYALTDDHNPDLNFNLQLNGTWKLKLDTSGQNLSITADYGKYLQNSEQRFKYNNYDAMNNFLGQTQRFMQTDPNYQVSALKLDYELPVTKHLTLKAGGKFVAVNVGVNNNFYNLVNDVGILDTVTTNSFRYTERIGAGYSSLNYRKGKLNLEAGLRYETWKAEGKQSNLGIGFKRNLQWFFPSANISWQLQGSQSLNLSYSRRINRPTYGFLNPYAFQMDAYTFYAGNPNLLPSLSHSAEITWSLLDGMLNLTASASVAGNFISGEIPFRFSDTSRRLLISPVNIPRQNNSSISASGSLEIRKWWQTEYYASVYNTYIGGQTLGTDLNINRNTFTANLNNTFQLGNRYKFSVSGFYNGPSTYGLGTVQAFGQLGINLSRSFWNNNGSLSINGQDILWTQVYQTNTNTPLLYNNGFFRMDSRVYSISFRYGFGGKAKQPAISVRDEDLQRLGSGR